MTKEKEMSYDEKFFWEIVATIKVWDAEVPDSPEELAEMLIPIIHADRQRWLKELLPEVKGHLLDMIRNLAFLVTKIKEHEYTSRQLLEFGVDKKAKK